MRSKHTQYGYGDEFGDTADNPRKDKDGYYNPSSVFGFGVAVPYDTESFANIRVELEELDDVKDRLGKNRRREIKTRKLSDASKTWVARRISKRSRSYVYAVDKFGEHPLGWDDYDPGERMVAMALYVVYDMVSNIDADCIHFIFDRHSALETPWAIAFMTDRMSAISAQTGKKITFDTRSSSNSDYSRELQVVDGVAHFGLLSLERGSPQFMRQARSDLRMLDSSDSIWYGDMYDYSRTMVKSKNRRGGDLPPCHGIRLTVTLL